MPDMPPKDPAAHAKDEYEEHRGGSHEYAVEHAPETELPIGEHARRLLERIREGEQGR